MRCDVCGEHFECATHKSHDAIGMPAGAPADDGFTATKQPFERRAIALAARYRMKIFCNRW
jgi:hypothetical protein